jgi:hypothetical protein
MEQKIVLRLLDLLPNLESLEIHCTLHVNENEESINWDLKSTKIERLKLNGWVGLKHLLESLEKCAIRELELGKWRQTNSEIIRKFLSSQEKSLKKFRGAHCDLSFLNDLKDLRLEYLDYTHYQSDINLLDCLKQQIDLKYLKLYISDEISNGIFEAICKLKNLQTLDLDGETIEYDTSGLDNLHKLVNLEILKLGEGVTENILDHLQFGVFEKLEELDASFYCASRESILDMTRITPNLKKIGIRAFSGAINALLFNLENFQNLKSVNLMKVSEDNWEVPAGKIYPKVLHINIDGKYGENFKQFTKAFPNLEVLQIEDCYIDLTDSTLVTLLSGLKQLKKLDLKFCIDFYNFELDREFVLQCFRDYGGHLEEISFEVIFEAENNEYFGIQKLRGGALQVENS